MGLISTSQNRIKNQENVCHEVTEVTVASKPKEGFLRRDKSRGSLMTDLDGVRCRGHEPSTGFRLRIGTWEPAGG